MKKQFFRKLEFAASAGFYPGILLGARSFTAEVIATNEETEEEADYMCYSTCFYVPFINFTLDLLIKNEDN
tara:strand:- start:685 stop:897 length:213 start_codon:yes stop_codon:yes gene_type:complete